MKLSLRVDGPLVIVPRSLTEEVEEQRRLRDNDFMMSHIVPDPRPPGAPPVGLEVDSEDELAIMDMAYNFLRRNLGNSEPQEVTDVKKWIKEADKRVENALDETATLRKCLENTERQRVSAVARVQYLAAIIEQIDVCSVRARRPWSAKARQLIADGLA